MTFASKQDLIYFVKEQCGIELKNIYGYLGECEFLLYTEIPKTHKISVLSLLSKYGIQTNEHLNNKYWIYLINDK